MALRHSVLVTQTLSGAAMQRLHTFFEVEIRIETVVPTRDELAQWLHGKAGVIADTRFIFDAQLVSCLPVLKAICNLDEAHHNLDLSALTSAGIRATSTPGADTTKLAFDAALESAWQLLVPMLQDALPLTGCEGRYNSRWSRKVLLRESVQSMCVGMVGEGALADALTARAQAARVQVIRPGLDEMEDDTPFWSRADVVVCCAAPDKNPAGVTASNIAMMKPFARVLNLAGTSGIAADVMRNDKLLSRITNGDAAMAVSAIANQQLARTDVTAEDLIASLGFGRNSWHPPHLLNPDIACESCC